MYTKAHNSRRDAYIHTTISTRPEHHTCISSRYVLQSSSTHTSRRAMYDDYDLDYTYSNDYGQDLDEYTQELDEDYARDTHDLEALAYRHYA